jgi:hypothetical protein
MIRAILFFFLLILFTGCSFCQSVNLGVELGGTLPQANYRGSTVDFYNGSKYGMKSGVNYGAMAKFRLSSTSMVIRTGISYFVLSNEGIAQAGAPGGRVETKSHILSILAGPEFNFPVSSFHFKPYLGANLLLSSIGAKVTFRNVSNVPSGTFIISSGTRLGLGISAGTEIRFSGVIMDVGARFNLYNIIGKEFVEIPPNDRVHSYLNVNDKKDTQFNNSNEHFISSDRHIAAFQFNLGVLFGL